MAGNESIQCEYLMEDHRSCLAVTSGEGEKVRKQGCVSESKSLCCNLCESKASCEISCAFHGTIETIPSEIPPEISNAIILEEKEKIIQAWGGWTEVFARVIVAKKERMPTITEAKSRQHGTLVLTNKRLVWMARRGFWDMSEHFSVEIPLERIRGVAKARSYVSVVETGVEHRFHLYHEALEEFDSCIRPLIQTRRKEVATEKRKERVKVLIDFSAIKDFLAKGGLKLQAIKCPVCDAPLKLPETGNRTKCEHCGNEIYAQDVFERIRELIT